MRKLTMHGRNLYGTFVKLLLHGSIQIIDFIIMNVPTKIKDGQDTETRVSLWLTRLVLSASLLM